MAHRSVVRPAADDADFRQVPADGVAQSGLFIDQVLADAVHHHHRLLLDALDRHKRVAIEHIDARRLEGAGFVNGLPVVDQNRSLASCLL